MSAIASKRFSDEFSSLLDKQIRVNLVTGGSLEGRLSAYNPTDYSLWLSDVKEVSGKHIPKIFISGRSIMSIEVIEAGPSLEKLAEKINKVFPNMVRYIREADVILVMDRIRVTKDGVVEGSGPAAEKVQKIYEEWLTEETG
ncbi:MAG: Lsm family RNA-binding protein [Aigarchaeota archaeon]|nr:Lsm family RNA-binding protein [Aigarchaeota archaeon]MCX8192317.1 Lsm family RNA-binding protein [Nitrososphaeria archaeon]MDW7986841.1 Lsm family RNA-binding protein [Nitrososphaerota archaeon]